MDAILDQIRLKQRDLILFLRDLVECESPSDSSTGIRRFNDLLAASVADIARCRFVRRHLLIEFKLPGRRVRDRQLLGLGHSDTVWPMGTLKTMP